MVENNLELKNISFSYKKKHCILNDLNAKFNSGEIIALLGINGSGKTTLFKILTGIYKADSGYVLYNNNKINEKNIIEFKAVLGFMPEYLQLYKNMTVTNVLTLLSSLKGYENSNIQDILESVYLAEHAQKKVKALSKGMKQRLNLAQAIIGDPKIILFDEPSNGFDCSSITMFYKTIRNLVNKGAIALLSSHHLTEIYGNVDKVLILSNGSIIKEICINNLNYEENFLYKDIYIILDESNNKNLYTLIQNKFKEVTIVNENELHGRVNNKIIIELITDLTKLNLKIKDIRIDNKILEDILIKLS
ncbi:MAG TPA: ABC transporter ATP-binding protein [Candidatus Azoamicus sp. MARI]